MISLVGSMLKGRNSIVGSGREALIDGRAFITLLGGSVESGGVEGGDDEGGGVEGGGVEDGSGSIMEIIGSGSVAEVGGSVDWRGGEDH